MISVEQVDFEVFSVYKTMSVSEQSDSAVNGRDLALLRLCNRDGALEYLEGRQKSFNKYGNSGYTYFALGSKGTLIKLNTGVA